MPALLPLWLGCLIAFFLLGVFFWVALEFPIALHQGTRGPLTALPSAPRLQSAPEQDLERYRSQKANELEAEGSAKGRRLGIENAMRATATQGWGPPK